MIQYFQTIPSPLNQERLEGRSVSDETIKKESMHINQSLSYLEQCVVALSRKHPGHVPYRQSKLTNVLKVGSDGVVVRSYSGSSCKIRGG